MSVLSSISQNRAGNRQCLDRDGRRGLSKGAISRLKSQENQHWTVKHSRPTVERNATIPGPGAARGDCRYWITLGPLAVGQAPWQELWPWVEEHSYCQPAAGQEVNQRINTPTPLSCTLWLPASHISFTQPDAREQDSQLMLWAEKDGSGGAGENTQCLCP